MVSALRIHSSCLLALLPFEFSLVSFAQYIIFCFVCLFVCLLSQAPKHVLVSAELAPLSNSGRRSRILSSVPGGSDSHLEEDEKPAWRTVDHFRNWQNTVLKSQVAKLYVQRPQAPF